MSVVRQLRPTCVALGLFFESEVFHLEAFGLGHPPAQAVVDNTLQVPFSGKFVAIAILGRIDFGGLLGEDAGEIFGCGDSHIEDYYAHPLR